MTHRNPLISTLQWMVAATLLLMLAATVQARPAPVCYSASTTACVALTSIGVPNTDPITLPGAVRVDAGAGRRVTLRIDLLGSVSYAGPKPVIAPDGDLVFFQDHQLLVSGNSPFSVSQLVVHCPDCLAGDAITAQVRAFDPNANVELFNATITLATVSGVSEASIDTVNPGGNANQQSLLRIINAGPEDAIVRILATDDAGAAGGVAELLIDAGHAVQLTSADIEAGNPDKGLVTGIGTGTGKWRLKLVSDSPGILVRNLIRNAGDGGIADFGGVATAQPQ